MSVRFAAANTPRRTVNKPNIYPPALQASALCALLAQGHADLAGLAESHTELLAALRRDRTFNVVRPRANVSYPATRIGTAALVLARWWSITDKRNLHLDWDGSPNGLNMPVTLARRATTGTTVAHMAGHLPTRGAADPDTWTRLAKQCRGYAETIPGPVALTFDWNRSRDVVAGVFTPARGWTVLGFGAVSGTVARGMMPKSCTILRAGYVPGVSDHVEGLVVSTARVTDPRKLEKLPRP